MAKPWKHPTTGAYYLYRQIPEPLRGEFGGRRFWKVSLRTKDAAEAGRLYPSANAELEGRLDAARKAVAEAAERDRISPERAEGLLAAWIVAQPVSDAKRWPTLRPAFWLEHMGQAVLGLGEPAPLPVRDEDGRLDPAAWVGRPIAGDGWLDVVQTRARSVWMRVCGHVLDAIFAQADPRTARTPENEATVMDAFNRRVREDNEKLRADLAAPQHVLSKPRLDPDLRLGALLERWKKKKAPKPQSAYEASGSVADFINWFGDLPCESITHDMILDYRDEAAKLPKTMPRADRTLSFRERLEKHGGDTKGRISPSTLKKRVGAIQALLSYGHAERWLSRNEGRDVKIVGHTRSARARRVFRDGELATLFASDIFVRPETWTTRRTEVSNLTLMWLFAVGLTSGARLEEVGQARLEDVRTDDGIVFIDIDEREIGDTIITVDGEDRDADDKSVKNAMSRRVVPLSERVLTIGFMQYVQALRDAGATDLFPDLVAGQFGKRTKEASRRANRYIDKVIGQDARLVFHSMRHRFKDCGRAADVNDTILDQITGHSPATVGARYGDGVDLKTLKRNLDRIPFSMVDWDKPVRAMAAVQWRPLADDLIARGTATKLKRTKHNAKRKATSG